MSTGEPKHRILVVEDEAMVSMLLEDMVLDCGCEIIGPVARFEEALALAQAAEFDVAVLDLNLNGTLSYPIAEIIRGRGIPVIFATGYGSDGLRDSFRDCRRSRSHSASRILPRPSRRHATGHRLAQCKAFRRTSENFD